MKNLRASYTLYKKSTENPVDINLYLRVCENYNKFLVNEVIAGEQITLPARCGTVEIIGKKQKPSFNEDGSIRGLAPDWKKTKELWAENAEAQLNRKVVFHNNSHTDGIRYKYIWHKNRVLVKNKILFSLVFTRENKRTLSSRILSREELDYKITIRKSSKNG